MSDTTTIYEIPKDWRLIASVDESQDYDVDESHVYVKPDGAFVLATASACSCWDGDYEVQEFASLDELVALVLNREGFVYNPSIAGAKSLVDQAREALA